MSDPEQPRLRAGVVGLGMMGRNHVRVWDESVDGVDLVAVADPDRAAVERATSGRRARGYEDPERMFAEERLDLVSIVAPTSLHLPVTLAALRAGANVLVEKPIAATREEATAMIEAAAGANRMLTVGHIERFNPAIRELRRRLDAGELGRIFQISATRLGPFPARIRDVGVVVDLAPHDLDVMRYLVGSEPIRIYAEAERRIHTEHEDLFNGIMKFENGVVGILDINWLTATKRRTLTVTGERGFYVADYIAQNLVLYANPEADQTWQNRGADGFGAPITSVAEGEMTSRSIRRAEPLTVELDEFARAVRDGGPPPVDPHDAMVALLLARKMVESALSGRAISGAELARGLGMKIAVVGLGHIGLPLAVQYASRGHDVLGVDVDSRIVETLNAGATPHPDEQTLIERVPELVAAGRLRATTWKDPAGFREADAVVVIVPVVVDADRQIDFGPIDAATRDIAANIGPARSSSTRRRCRSARLAPASARCSPRGAA